MRYDTSNVLLSSLAAAAAAVDRIAYDRESIVGSLLYKSNASEWNPY